MGWWGEQSYVGEKDTWDAASGMQPLLMTFLSCVATSKTALVARHAVLVCLDAVGGAFAVLSQCDELVRDVEDAVLLIPAEREVGCRHNFDEVHVVVCLLIGLLLSVIEWVEVVIRPRHTLLADSLDDFVGQLRAKAQVVHFVRERVLDTFAAGKVVLQVMYVHVAIAKTLAGCEVEVSNHFVDTDATLDTTSLAPLLVQVLAVVFPLALLDILAAPE